MDKPVNCDAAERIEQLYRYAELKAVARQDLSDEIETSHENSSFAPASDVRFVLAAKGELERRALRTRYLPIELSADTGWALLLDLFVSEAQPSSVKAAHCCNRWNLSHSTFARLRPVWKTILLVDRRSPVNGPLFSWEYRPKPHLQWVNQAPCSSEKPIGFSCNQQIEWQSVHDSRNHGSIFCHIASPPRSEVLSHKLSNEIVA